MAAAASEFRVISKVVALVTGAASGLGRATAARLTRQVRTVVFAMPMAFSFVAQISINNS